MSNENWLYSNNVDPKMKSWDRGQRAAGIEQAVFTAFDITTYN